MRQLTNMRTKGMPRARRKPRTPSPAVIAACRPAISALATTGVPAWGWLLVAGWLGYGFFEPLLSAGALTVALNALALQTAVVVALLIAVCGRQRSAPARQRTHTRMLTVLVVLLCTAGVISMLKGERPSLERRATLALVRADYERALALSANHAARGDAGFQFLMYRVYSESPRMYDSTHALMWLERAAAAGDPRAVRVLQSYPSP
jgi:hypothetical protein